MSADLIRPDSNQDESMGFLDAFNHLGRHSLWKTSSLAQLRRSRSDAAQVYIGVLATPYIVSVIKQDVKMAFAAAAITGGYFAAGHIHKKLAAGKSLDTLSAALSKWDIPLFLGGNAYLLNTYAQDIFSPSTSPNVGNPFLIVMASAVLWAGLPKIPRAKKTRGDDQAAPLLPPPKAG